MKTNTRKKIIEYVKTHGQARPHDLVKELGISQVALHKQLAALISQGLLVKRGRPPLVFYILPQEEKSTELHGIPSSQKDLIDKTFLFITPIGKLLFGSEGFSYWTNQFQKGKSLSDTAKMYEKTLLGTKVYTTHDGWIDATEKMKQTFSDCQVDHLLLTDIYSYPIFGRTKLAKLVMYAKQTENRTLISPIVAEIKPILENVIKKYLPQAVIFIPPTVPRKIQLIDEIKHGLHISIPIIPMNKVLAGDIAIPQKTIPRLEDRVTNAKNTMFLTMSTPDYSRILLIDDVVGSGASFQEAARKIRTAEMGKDEITAFALVGNIKGFEVIREM